MAAVRPVGSVNQTLSPASATAPTAFGPRARMRAVDSAASRALSAFHAAAALSQPRRPITVVTTR
jgi:hypothetical protein